MNPVGKELLAAVVAISIMSVVLGSYYLSTSAILAGQERTIADLQSTVSSLLSKPVSSMAVSTTTISMTRSVTLFPNVPFANPLFLAPSGGPNRATCSVGFCWESNFSDSILFDCPNATTQGCTVELYESAAKANYSITASPQVGQANAPIWANCSWKSYVLSPVPNVPPSLAGGGFGYCVPIGSSAFIISMPLPPPA